MRYLSTVYVAHDGACLTRHRNTLRVSVEDRRLPIPLRGIDLVVLTGRATLTTEALDLCLREGVRVASLTLNGRLRFVVGGPRAGNVHLRLAQYRAADDPDQTFEIARTIVAAKLRNCRVVIQRWARDVRSPLRASVLRSVAEFLDHSRSQLATVSTTDQVRGVEGDAARVYFRGVRAALEDSPFEFLGRVKRPPRDPVNAALSYAYTLLTVEYTAAADTVGLDPQIGFLHRARSGRPSLALDLVEEVRAHVDRLIVGAIRRRMLTPDLFETTPGGAVRFTEEGRRRFFELWDEDRDRRIRHPAVGRDVERWAIPTLQMTILARHLRGDLPHYLPMVLDNRG